MHSDKIEKSIKNNKIALQGGGQDRIKAQHEKCAEINELQCVVCGAPAGCPQCEFQENCDIPNVSQLCICKKCSEEKDAFRSYQKSVKKKFLIINS